MKNKKKIVASIIALILLVLIIGIFKLYNQKEIKLIQLSSQSKSQMMGYIIKTKNDKLVIIDGGITEDTQNLMKYINNNGDKVDYWFLTHAHNDHVSAFTEIVNNEKVEIRNIFASLNEKEYYKENEPERSEFSEYLIDTLNKENIRYKVKSPDLNEVLYIDGIKVEILGIKNPEITENAGNEQSMVIKFDTGKTTLLILGDTGEKSSEKLLVNQKEKLKSDIVQMSHHGQAGATRELYEQINPRICLWPTPDWLWDNDKGEGKNTGPWKTLETRSWIKDLKVRKNYIAKDGDIIIKIK